MKPRRSSRLILLASVLLLVVALYGFYAAFVSVQNKEAVVVATKDLPAFKAVEKGDIQYKDVPKSSITSDEITKVEYEDQYVKTKMAFVPTAQVLKGQRLDQRDAAKDPKASFAIVSPDERVVAVTASLSGAAVGTIHSGDIVDVTQAGNSNGTGASASFAKVICISDKSDGCKNVIAPGISVSGDSSSNDLSDDAAVNVLLAVADEDATSLAGQTVALALNPFCSVDENGMFVQRPGSPTPCQISPDDAGRDAAKGAQGSADDSASTQGSADSTSTQSGS